MANVYNNVSSVSRATSSSGGIGMIGLLFVALVVLKLTGYITWSWWIILTMPIWAFFGIIALVLLTTLVAVGVWVAGVFIVELFKMRK